MRQVREVLRLKHVCGHSGHQIAAMVGVSRYAVAEYLRRAAVVGITWPVPAALDDVALERKLFTPPYTPEPGRPQPEWARIHAELRRPGVTLLLLREEDRAGQPDGYGYSRFCDLARGWRGRLSPTMRHSHPVGERLFVDYAGQTAEVIDGATGEIRRSQIFVAVLGASNLTYAEARWTQALPDWIGCCIRQHGRRGPADRLRQPQGRCDRRQPLRARHPPNLPGHGDPLRHGDPTCPGAQAARQGQGRGWRPGRAALGAGPAPPSPVPLPGRAERRDPRAGHGLNNRPMRHLGTSRRALFEAIERQALLALPDAPYAYAEWRAAGPAWITTSRCTGTSFRCRIAWCAR